MILNYWKCGQIVLNICVLSDLILPSPLTPEERKLNFGLTNRPGYCREIFIFILLWINFN